METLTPKELNIIANNPAVQNLLNRLDCQIIPSPQAQQNAAIKTLANQLITKLEKQMKTIIIVLIMLSAYTNAPGGTPPPGPSQLGKSSFSDPGTDFWDDEKKQHNTVSSQVCSAQTRSITYIMLSIATRVAKPFFCFSNGENETIAFPIMYHVSRFGNRLGDYDAISARSAAVAVSIGLKYRSYAS